MPRPVMLIDSEICMNCKACVVACQQRNNVPYGYSRNWVRETAVPETQAGWKYQPGACMHCQYAPCLPACPTGATYRTAAGVVVIDTGVCVGCGACIDACPYGARFRHPVGKVADKCDYCLASGGGEPACVSVCPVGCRVFGDMDDPSSPVSIALKGRKAVYVAPENMDPGPTLAYLDATTPVSLPPAASPAGPLSALGPLSQAVAWIGGLTLVALGGVFGRQLLKSSEAEEREIADARQKSGKNEDG